MVEGRWHSKGHLILYCSDGIDVALAEVEKHLDLPPILFPSDYLILKIRIPATAKIFDFEPNTLPDNWADDYKYTQPLGDSWLESTSTPVARVPSALFAGRSNYLINPVHRMADFIEILEQIPVSSYLSS